MGTYWMGKFCQGFIVIVSVETYTSEKINQNASYIHS